MPTKRRKTSKPVQQSDSACQAVQGEVVSSRQLRRSKALRGTHASRQAVEKRGTAEKAGVVQRDAPRCLLSLPNEILHDIFFKSQLSQVDHLCVSLSCKQLREFYDNDACKSLCGLFWTNQPPNFCTKRWYDPESFTAENLPRPRNWQEIFVMNVLRSCHKCGDITSSHDASHWVPNRLICRDCDRKHFRTVVRSVAKKEFKISDADLNTLKFREQRNPHGRNLPPMRLYLHDAVVELSNRKFGDGAGLEAAKHKDADRAAKARATKERSGTTCSPRKIQKTRIYRMPTKIYDGIPQHLVDEAQVLNAHWAREAQEALVARYANNSLDHEARLAYEAEASYDQYAEHMYEIE